MLITCFIYFGFQLTLRRYNQCVAFSDRAGDTGLVSIGFSGLLGVVNNTLRLTCLFDTIYFNGLFIFYLFKCGR